MNRRAIMMLACLAAATPALGDDAGRILRKQVVVAAHPAAVWNAWTTPEGLRFVSERSNVELAVGGPYEWFLDLEPDPDGRRGSEGSRVLAYLPQELLAFDWTFPPSIPSLRRSGARTQVVVQFDAVDARHTRVRFAQLGWREGEDWDAGYAYFDAAWDHVLTRLRESFEAAESPSP